LPEDPITIIARGDEIAHASRAHAVRQERHRAHLAELMRRLGIRGVAGLTRYAVRVGLVTP